MDSTRDIRGIEGRMMEEQVEEGREVESEAEEVVVLEYDDEAEEVVQEEKDDEAEEQEEVVVLELDDDEEEVVVLGVENDDDEEEEVVVLGVEDEDEDEEEEEEEVVVLGVEDDDDDEEEEVVVLGVEDDDDDEEEEEEEEDDDDDDEEKEVFVLELETDKEEDDDEEEEEEDDFGCDIDDFETARDIICYIKEKISHPALKSFLSLYLDDNNLYSTMPPSEKDGTWPLGLMEEYLNEFEIYLMTTTILVENVYHNQRTMKGLLSIAHGVEHLLEEIVPLDSEKQLNSRRDDLRNDWNTLVYNLREIMKNLIALANGALFERQFLHKAIDKFTNSLNVVKDLEMLLFDKADSSESITLDVENEELLLIKAFPAFVGLKESSDKVNFLLETIPGLKSFTKKICRACDRQPRIVLLIGGLLSFKSPDSNIWHRVIQEVDGKFKAASGSTDNFIREIYWYCFIELYSNLQHCFLQLACYPIGYEISIASITKIWIAEGFIKPKVGETTEETSYKYVEELAQRSLIWVSRRSISGTIKYLRVPRSAHEWVIEWSRFQKHLITNPDYRTMRSWKRVAIHNDNKNQYTEVRCIKLHSFLAFHIDRNVLRSARFLKVLELRNCEVGVTDLEKMPHLQYLGLRGSNISNLPENIGNMKDLQTLDVRDTNIEILPESLWNISTLRHVYVNPGPRIQGPPPTANIPNLQILKTVGVPESWPEKVPHLPINLRKLALSFVGHLELETISNPLSRMVNLLSIAIKAPLIPAELVDTRAFPNLDTLKSIEFVGIWNFRKLPIDNFAFPSNLAKLILSNSHLKEDPMPRLERLQALKLLKLEDGAYTGEKMVCSANGFPQLQFLQLSQLENLKIWEVKTMAMSNLSTLRVMKCRALKISLPDFEHVKDIVIDNYSLVPYVHV